MEPVEMRTRLPVSTEYADDVLILAHLEAPVGPSCGNSYPGDRLFDVIPSYERFDMCVLADVPRIFPARAQFSQETDEAQMLTFVEHVERLTSGIGHR